LGKERALSLAQKLQVPRVFTYEALISVKITKDALHKSLQRLQTDYLDLYQLLARARRCE
jgi:aryl-alcohol dehydrogenase-like predicted oxidoreductase